MGIISTHPTNRKVVMVSITIILSMVSFASPITSLVDQAKANHNLINHPSEQSLGDIQDFIYDQNQEQPWACPPGDIGCAIYGIGSPEIDLFKYHKLCNSNENPDGIWNTDEFDRQTQDLISDTDEYLNCLSGYSPCY